MISMILILNQKGDIMISRQYRYVRNALNVQLLLLPMHCAVTRSNQSNPISIYYSLIL